MNHMKRDTRLKINNILGIMIVVFTVIGLIVMIVVNSEGSGLSDKGLRNLKYFTVQSNILAAVVQTMILISRRGRDDIGRRLYILKMVATAAVFVTFSVVAFFFGPLYGHSHFYHGSNLWFHLIVPVICIADFLITEQNGSVKKRDVFYSAIPPFLYGSVYLANILINGLGNGETTNDWYGFVNWGLPVGIVIFAGIMAVSVLVSLLLLIPGRVFVLKSDNKNSKMI
ncbi:MAG: Pr6Pr family membrane protein [Lachnospiraceae bacterium]|nr:Pr6Pr family membrane protein [Lachnospiraceae bacterium]